jgi:hypothetical protein
VNDPTPYVSVAFVNRNDGYGGDLEERIAKFIDYYARYARMWPALLEFVIVDWNPPLDRPKLATAFDWSALGAVTHVEVPPEVHAEVAKQRGRKMLDYFGRNVAIRRSRGQFCLVINQDIFVGDSIMRLIAAHRLSLHHFYRADRCDFDFEPCRRASADKFEQAAFNAAFQLHRRHRSTGEPISVGASSAVLATVGSGAERGDLIDRELGIIDCASSVASRESTKNLVWQWRWLRWRRRKLSAWHDLYCSEKFHRSFFLHTNAAGDFLLAPREAFSKICGFPESLDVYMHTDSYAVVQLFAASYKQAIFVQPHRVFHADHDRSARAGFSEAMTWNEHEVVLSAILRGERSFRLNGAGWGLAGRDLPQFRLM